jgi:xanthine dehydrogenase molybdopterin binding subunit
MSDPRDQTARSVPHESAVHHVTGAAVYVDDIATGPTLLVGHAVASVHARARIRSIDLEAARGVPGVRAVLSHADIPGANQMGPVVHDEPVLAPGEVHCVGQAVVLIAAETKEQCLEAERLVRIEYEPLEAVLTLEEAIARKSLLGPPAVIRRGDAAEAVRTAPHRLTGSLRTGAQEHWYLESQVALCVPGEGREMYVHSSTQHPSETQALVAEVLGIQKNEVTVEVRRMGGAFGGKETQANHTACWAALLARATTRPVKMRLFRDDDMRMTGKRHRFLSTFDVGFDPDGRILGLEAVLHCDGGCATDLTFAILQRAMLHADNAYYLPHATVTGIAYRTNLPSNTAFRGFGGPQGMALIEDVVDRIARHLRLDPAEVRRRNFYGGEGRDVTPYGQRVERNHLGVIMDQLSRTSRYAERRAGVAAFNAAHEFVKRGIAMTPVKFGISFTTSFLNQAGALVLIYKDGTILVNHGGTEMGQGLHTKIRQIAAAEFGVALESVKVNATSTAKVPNTSATAASAGTDLNGMAVKDAADTLKARISAAMAPILTGSAASDATRAEDIVFAGGRIADGRHPERSRSFAESMPMMHLAQVSLSATGFYRTPSVGWDSAKGFGRPFYYFAYGMAVTEAEVDLLTGRHTILRADILHDVGDSLNPMIDIGQVEGGYVQGLGWCTTEEIKWDARGNLLTHSPDTYKIPAVRDIPREFHTALLSGVPNPGTIRASKAVAEPPFMLALSAWLAIKDAVSAAAGHAREPEFSLPATYEVVLLSLERLKSA